MMIKTFAVFCDGCGGHTSQWENSKEARAAARRRKWKRIPKGSSYRYPNGADFCPGCAEDGTA